ncbi:hypothetical protein LEP1GSC060_0782 [Leptospira weilii serovar Ranarum str. ICFT]|uniref:Uncharacterized protein n=1 Tax=Leptospira weilii serovar Ranarum str. ICFT TaxID=1218598 RepID=N1WNR7_9LEPT|nr:hypothetical protein [Leptospira weilii]EMY78887.1 hypothetical protein LEP1GSC060_0782 [Leptospira weilii serovar Ranarum str. ICFT]
MNGNPKLFGRVASLEILPKVGLGKEFRYPPFDLEFETELDKLNLTKVTLYNVNEDTVRLVGAKSKGKGFQYPTALLNAGYKDENGLVVSGEVILPKFKREGTEKKLEFQISGNAGSWSGFYIMKTYTNLPAQTVILDILNQGNIKPGRITLGENKIVNFSANTTLGDCIRRFCNLTKSEYWFQDGFLHIDSRNPSKKNSGIYLDHSSGLIGVPEKGRKTWKVTSLFRHKFKKNTVITVKGGGLDSECRIVSGKHKFSTFDSSNYSELEVLPI